MSSKIKKIASILLCATLMMTLLAGCGGAKSIEQADEATLTNDSKVLIVYFSWSGHLQTMSHWIADETGGDIVRVVTKEPYPEV